MYIYKYIYTAQSRRCLWLLRFRCPPRLSPAQLDKRTQQKQSGLNNSVYAAANGRSQSDDDDEKSKTSEWNPSNLPYLLPEHIADCDRLTAKCQTIRKKKK